MTASVRTKTDFPLLATTALVSAALLTVGPIAPAQIILTAVMATQNHGGGGVLKLSYKF